LFNSHTHLPMTLLRGYSDDLQLFPWLQKVWKLEKHFSAESCAVGAELAFLEMIKGGTGGFVDFYFHEDHILEPARAWPSIDTYMKRYRSLASRFIDNFKKFEPGTPREIVEAGPKI